jgi:hypothetical protein
MFSRHIFSADFEFQRYVELAARTKLNPLCLEITKDRFASINPDKHRRGKMAFRLTKQVRSLRVIDFGCDGTCIADVRTLASQPLVEYHHQLLTEFHPNFINSIVDASDWLLAGGRIKPGYHHYLALAIADGILFENFLPDDAQERSFLIERVLPSFDFLVAHFGVKPLIVRLFTKEQEQEPWIWQYPGEVYPLAHDLVTRRYSDSSDPYAS